MTAPAPEREMANALRALAMDAVQAANSGHPGMPMGMAEIAVALWHRNLSHNPANPAWPNRDRFVLSNGHGSMLLYSLLHLTGYDLPMAELKRFRQLHSKTPGHPEYGCAPGVETTTGPLGQGISNAVGMAIAERLLAAEFNRPGHEIVDHRTYAFLGDGCMMEGVSHEACALAGTLGLGKLIAVYDDNGISIDSEKGSIRQWYTDDVRRRFEAYGWQVIPNVDGHDVEAVDRALRKAKRETRPRPTLICAQAPSSARARRPRPTPAARTARRSARRKSPPRARRSAGRYPPFEIPEAVRAGLGREGAGQARRAALEARVLGATRRRNPELAKEFLRRMSGALPVGFSGKDKNPCWQDTNLKAETIATRKASQNALKSLVPALPELIGGSADLAGSNLTIVKASKADRQRGRRQLPVLRRARVRHGRDHERPRAARRLHSLRRHLPGVLRLHAQFAAHGGADGASARSTSSRTIRSAWARTARRTSRSSTPPRLRLIPNLDVWRPCDAMETAVAWTAAIQRRNGPTALAAVAPEPAVREAEVIEVAGQIQKGGYVLADAPGAKADPDRHRLRGAARARGAEAARFPGAGGFHALDQRVRPPARRLQGAACCPGACRASRSRQA